MGEDQLPPALLDWIPRQRWYAGKGQGAALSIRGGWTLTTPSAHIITHFVLDRQPSGTTLYQVPLTRRTVALPEIAELWRDDTGYFYDGPHDPAYVEAVFGLILDESEAEGARGHRQPGTRPVRIVASSVLTGEQSNTSIVCRVDEGSPIILKVFRALHAGDNPDVVLQSAISATGSDLVPASVGYLSGEWSDGAEPGGFARGSLAFAQRFVEGAEDAWRTALRAASAGEDFSLRARRLGEETAQLHLTLAEAMPTREPTDADRDRMIAAMGARADAALEAVPELAPYRGAIEAARQAVRHSPWPRLQRIHGDFHLGQVLSVGQNWVMVDFEGEPLRPMKERSELDLPLRDVAGMLRSFDYVAGAVEHQGSPLPELSPTEWARNARIAFLSGYSDGSRVESGIHGGLLDALELDKALYEAIYEARNRPDWLGIPVEAVKRLAGLLQNGTSSA